MLFTKRVSEFSMFKLIFHYNYVILQSCYLHFTETVFKVNNYSRIKVKANPWDVLTKKSWISRRGLMWFFIFMWEKLFMECGLKFCQMLAEGREGEGGGGGDHCRWELIFNVEASKWDANYVRSQSSVIWSVAGFVHSLNKHHLTKGPIRLAPFYHFTICLMQYTCILAHSAS